MPLACLVCRIHGIVCVHTGLWCRPAALNVPRCGKRDAIPVGDVADVLKTNPDGARSRVG